MSRPAQLAVAAAALVVSSLYSISVLASPGRLATDSQRWPGHYTLLVGVQEAPAGDERGALRTAAARLASRWSVVSRFTAFERVNAFAALERVRVADLPARLDDADPRFDPHLRALPALFAAVASSAGGAALGAPDDVATAGTPARPRPRFEVMYARSEQSPLAFLVSARFLLRGSGVSVSLAELTLGHTLLSLLLLLTGVAIAWLAVPTNRVLLWVAALPYVAVALASDVGVAALGAGLYVLVFWLAPVVAGALLDAPLPADGGRRRRRAAAAAATGAGLAALVLLSVVDETLVLAGSVQLAAVLLTTAAATLRRRPGYLPILTRGSRATIRASLALARRPRADIARGARRPALAARAVAVAFRRVAAALRRPLSGLRSRLTPGSLRPLTALPLAATVAVGLPLLASHPDGDATLVASPPGDAVPVAVTSLGQLTAVPAQRPSLPSLSSLVSHAAYQAALPYGGSYRLPQVGDSLTLPRFTLAPNGEVRRWTQELRRFDDRWLQQLLSEPERGSVLSLLAAVGDAQPVLAAAGGGTAAAGRAVRLGVAAALLLLAAGTLTRISRCATTPARPRRAVGRRAEGVPVTHPARIDRPA